MMDSWIWQPGYPLVTAGLDGDAVVLRQQRFAFGDPSGAGDLAAGAAASWLVPVHVRAGNERVNALLDQHDVRVPVADASAPVIVNAGGHGFFRVAYDDELRARLGAEVLGGLSTLERYNLVDDAWNEVVAGRLAAADFLTFVEGFGAERELAVWQSIVVGLRGLGRLLDDNAYPAFQSRVRALLAPVVADLGEPADGEDDLRRKLRGMLTATLAVLGDDAATQARGAELYEASVADPAAVDPELVAAATSIVAAGGGDSEYARMLDGYRNGATPQDQLRHLYALAEFDREDLILRTCELAMSGEIKTQNAPFLLRTCVANRRHGASAWRFVRQHWEQANTAFPTNTIVRMIDSVRLLTDEAVAADVQSFFAEHPIQQAAKTLEQVLERQRVNTALRAREADRFAAALA